MFASCLLCGPFPIITAVVNETKLVTSSTASCTLILSDPINLGYCTATSVRPKGNTGLEQALPVRCALGFSALGSVSVTAGKREKKFKCVEGRCEG